jgi:SulP family sulfate permease
MTETLRAAFEAVSSRVALRPATALRACLAEGYDLRRLRADLLAGIVVGVVALPLSMALAIASGVPPQYGLYTAIVAGLVTPLLGGSRTQVTGPTAAFVVLLAPVSVKFGIAGLLTASLMAGAILVVMGGLRLGSLIEFIPLPVTTGFTAGIAVVIALLQVKDLLGLTTGPLPEHFLEKAGALVRALPTARWEDAATAAVTLVLLLGWTRVTRRVPAALVALAAAAVLAGAASRWMPGFHVATIGERFTCVAGGRTWHGIPALPPLPLLPWNLPGPEGGPFVLSMAALHALFPYAAAIAMLGAIESLLSAVVADGMAGTRTDPDAELVAQGAGNLVAPFFGGFAATGALARTATNIRSGGRTPFAAVFHALFVLAAVLALAPLIGWLPMASLAALLLLVAWNMAELRHVDRLLRAAPKSDVTVLLTTLSLTVLFDMVVSVTVGVMLAALLFMRRMAELSGATLVGEGDPKLRGPLPREVVLYDVAGPLFFGAAGRAMASLETLAGHVRVVILDLEDVPAIDATGLVVLEESVERLAKRGVLVVLAGLQAQPARALAKAGLAPEEGRLVFAASRELALGIARARAAPGPA